MSTAARCVFCGAPGTSREHVFASWIAALFADATPFTLTKSLGRTNVTTKDLGVSLRAACAKCNNEWMSEFEVRAKPVLVPAMRGEQASWAQDDQERVARWALKTALMLDRSRPEPYATLAEHFDYLFRTACHQSRSRSSSGATSRPRAKNSLP